MKEFNYCPYCGEQIKDERELQDIKEDKNYFFDIDKTILKRQKIVVISLPLESMIVPFKYDSQKVPENFKEEVGRRKQALIDILKRLEKGDYNV